MSNKKPQRLLTSSIYRWPDSSRQVRRISINSWRTLESARLVLPSDRKLSISIAAAWNIALSFISNWFGCYDAPDTYNHLLIDETVTVWVYRSISIPRSELLCLLAWVGQPEIDIHPALPEQLDCRLDSG